MVNSPSGASDVTSVISGGKIGGLLRYRDDVLVPSMNDLGRTALVVADRINSQLGQGLDVNGEFGASLFSNVNSAAAISQRSLVSSDNTGSSNFEVTIADSSALTTFDYAVTVDTTTNLYSVKRSDGKDMGAFGVGSVAAFDGLKIELKGTPPKATRSW